MKPPVAVLFACKNSIYHQIHGCDVYDIDRDARTFTDDRPVIAHPPCRAWSSFRNFAKPLPGEKQLGFFAVDKVRSNGGVLEHPLNSMLWPAAGLPGVGEIDEYGGFTTVIDQFWFGHRAQKRTRLYIVGVLPLRLPPYPLTLGRPPRVVTNNKKIPSGSIGYRKEITPSEREATPYDLACWLLNVALDVRYPRLVA